MLSAALMTTAVVAQLQNTVALAFESVSVSEALEAYQTKLKLMGWIILLPSIVERLFHFSLAEVVYLHEGKISLSIGRSLS